MALVSYSVWNKPSWLRLNIIGGLELLRSNTGQGKTEKHIDTTTDIQSRGIYLNPHKLLLFNLGMSTEFLIRGQSYGELRLMSGVGFTEYTSLSMGMNNSGTLYESKRSTNGSYVNLSFLLNLSTILFERLE